jgi:hypothetical protein
MLSKRQQESIEHLKLGGVTDPKEIVQWAQNNLLKFNKTAFRKPRRKHSKKYYQQIIEHYLPLAMG